jgi:hypothetical protein
MLNQIDHSLDVAMLMCGVGCVCLAAAFPPLGYWRGFVWAPWAQLTYWALENPRYSHLPLVVQTRKAVAKQMTAMMMNVWDSKRHIWYACSHASFLHDVVTISLWH